MLNLEESPQTPPPPLPIHCPWCKQPFYGKDEGDEPGVPVYLGDEDVWVHTACDEADIEVHNHLVAKALYDKYKPRTISTAEGLRFVITEVELPRSGLIPVRAWEDGGLEQPAGDGWRDSGNRGGKDMLRQPGRRARKQKGR